MTAHAFRGLDPCVHCGFCLPACPTYEATLDESDSPRGRIVLMRALQSGDLGPADDALALHLDRCLGCRACESACPSGVSYGPALEAARLMISWKASVSTKCEQEHVTKTPPGSRDSKAALLSAV